MWEWLALGLIFLGIVGMGVVVAEAVVWTWRNKG